jgi:hypothetical protein
MFITFVYESPKKIYNLSERDNFSSIFVWKSLESDFYEKMFITFVYESPKKIYNISERDNFSSIFV